MKHKKMTTIFLLCAVMLLGSCSGKSSDKNDIKNAGKDESMNGLEISDYENSSDIDNVDINVQDSDKVSYSEKDESVSYDNTDFNDDLHNKSTIPDCLEYIIEDNEVTIQNCDTSASGELEIPSIIEGYPVTSIGDYAFSECTSLTSFTIPNTVTSIGDYAFANCFSLTDLYFKGTVEEWNAITVGKGRMPQFTIHFNG